MKYFKCENCGSELSKNADNTYTCGYCRRTYYDDSLEKAYDRVYQNLRDTVRGVVSEELLKQKIEQIANCRQALYKSRNGQFIDSKQVEKWSEEILKLSPEDAQANFYALAAKKRWSELNKFMQKLNAREVDYLVEGFVDYLTNGQFAERCILSLNDLIGRAFDSNSSEFSACHKKINKAAANEKSGIFDVELSRDVFVAYSSKDKEQAYELVEFLEESGFSCFIAMRNLAKGVDAELQYNERLKKAIDNCQVFVLVSSKNSRSRDCDAYNIEMRYVKEQDIRRADNVAFANAHYELYLEKNRKRCKPRIEYLIEEYGISRYEQEVKKFFGGLTWRTDKNEVVDDVFEYIENAGLEESEEEKLAREKAELESNLAKMQKEKAEADRQAELARLAREKELEETRLAKLEKEKELEDAKLKAELERERLKAELEELKNRKADAPKATATENAASGNIEDLYRAFKERERAEEEERKRQAEEERKRQAEEQEKEKKRQAEEKRKAEAEAKRAEAERLRKEQERQQALAAKGFVISGNVLQKYKGSDPVLVIPDGITAIGANCCKSNGTLRKVVIPDSVTKIGESAFFGCTSLTSVVIGSGVIEVDKPHLAFSSCDKIVEVCNRSSIDLIPKKKDGEYGTFDPKPQIVYSGEDRNLVYADENGYVLYKDETDFTVLGYEGASKNLVIPEGVTAIYRSAFYERADLTSVKLPVSLVEIRASAFIRCEKLKEIEIPDGVTKIGPLAFSGCKSLASVKFGASVEIIGFRAFLNCAALKEIRFPDTPLVVANYAFQGCSGVTKIELGNRIVELGDSALDASTLEYLDLPLSLETVGAFAVSAKTFYTAHPKKPKGWKTQWKREGQKVKWGVESYAAEQKAELKKQEEAKLAKQAEAKRKEEVEKQKQALAAKGFKINADNELTKYTGKDECVVVPDDVEGLAYACFDGATVKSVKLGKNVSSIRSGAFETDCVNLESIEVDAANEYYKSVDGVLYSKDGRYLVKYPAGKKATEFVAPSCVTHIEKSAVYAAKNLKKVVLPRELHYIGGWAFAGCAELTEIDLGEKVQTIEERAFSNCTSIEKIVIPATVVWMGENVFFNCWNIVICAEVKSEPRSWEVNWNPTYAKVKWGYDPQKEAEKEAKKAQGGGLFKWFKK